MKKNLTLRYALNQLAYWASAAGIMSFATAYLLYKGLAPSRVGTLMACGTVLSCITQPLLASFADRAKKPMLPLLITGLSLASTLCFALILFGPAGEGLLPLLYLCGVWSFDAMLPLINSVSVYYPPRGYALNFGLARGIGSLSYAAAALLIGRVMESFGADWMLRIVLVLLPLMALLGLGYPRDASPIAIREDVPAQSGTPCTVGQFFLRYRWYCLSLTGITCLALFHTMTENYLIAIMGRLGGDSSHVGTALFIATAGESITMFSLSRIRRHVRDTLLLRIAALSFLIKSILFILAPSIPFLYAVQLMQMLTYALLAPVQIFYAGSRVRPEDTVKGQAFVNAFYSLGGALGNFLGGLLMEWRGVSGILTAGVIFAAAGLCILLLTLERKDAYLTSYKGASL